MVRSKRFFMKFYLVLIIAFLYIPIAVLVVLSFNNSRSRVVWGGLDSYRGQMAGSYAVAVPDEQRDALEGFFASEPSIAWERLDGGER